MQIKAISFFIALYLILIVVAVPSHSGNSKRAEEQGGKDDVSISSVNLRRRRHIRHKHYPDSFGGASYRRTRARSNGHGGDPLAIVTKTVETLVDSVPIPKA